MRASLSKHSTDTFRRVTLSLCLTWIENADVHGERTDEVAITEIMKMALVVSTLERGREDWLEQPGKCDVQNGHRPPSVVWLPSKGYGRRRLELD
ncbi:hypothetical protein MTO96_033957 [Rhipicephalus appendiculatus]